MLTAILSKRWKATQIGGYLVSLVILAGCAMPTRVQPTATQDPAQIATQAVQTVLAEFTRQAAQAGLQATWTATLEYASDQVQAPTPTTEPQAEA